MPAFATVIEALPPPLAVTTPLGDTVTISGADDE
jgi:hypothetical protein